MGTTFKIGVVVLVVLLIVIPALLILAAYFLQHQAQTFLSGTLDGKPGDCDNLVSGTLRDYCYMVAGIGNMSLTLCEEIQGKDTRLVCEAAVTKDPRVCLQSTPENVKGCLEDVIGEVEDEKVCVGLGSKYESTCMYYAATNKNATAETPKLCALIENTTLKDRCLQYAALSPDNKTF